MGTHTTNSKAGISFIHLSDGSSFHPVQVVAPNTLSNYTDEVLKLTSGCAIEATGMVVLAVSPAKGQPFEMQAGAIDVIGWVDDRIPIRSNQSHTRWNSYVRWPISGPEPT